MPHKIFPISVSFQDGSRGVKWAGPAWQAARVLPGVPGPGPAHEGPGPGPGRGWVGLGPPKAARPCPRILTTIIVVRYQARPGPARPIPQQLLYLLGRGRSFCKKKFAKPPQINTTVIAVGGYLQFFLQIPPNGYMAVLLVFEQKKL